MNSLLRIDDRFLVKAIALAAGIWGFSVSTTPARAGDHIGVSDATMDGPAVGVSHSSNALDYGTLGYGPYGLYRGFQGFGLSFHRGYGYGGLGRGVGAEGGYPYYAGPGYPHGEPPLRRFCGISRTTYYGGAGDFGQSVDRAGIPERVSVEEYGAPYYLSFGPMSGGPPDPERFARFAAEAATMGTYVEPGSSLIAVPPAETAPLPVQGRYLGIDEEPVVDPDGVPGIKVIRVHLGTAAERADLHAGDVIHSINGYRTTVRGNLAWIIANAAPANLLTIRVRTVADGKVHVITAQLPIEPVNTSRPYPLPPAGNGPPPATR